MLNRILLPGIFVVLAYGFWISPEFKVIAAGLAIFLFGMLALEEGFRAFTGGTLETLLGKATDRHWKSIGFGIASTTLVQSSSLVSLITISFLSAGLINLAAGIGVIFGSNLGTTTGAWLVAGLGLKVKISAYAMPLLVFGVLLILQKSKLLKGIGYGLTGLGLLFLGIHYMKEGFEAFRDTINLAEYAVSGYAGIFLFAFIGAAATLILQSSHATLVLIITALAAHQITYENALALAIGANIGTTVTAMLGAISANVEGKRLAVAHLVFNTITALVAIAFLQPLLWSVDAISAAIGISADDYTLKLAVFHTLFNLIGLILMAPFIKVLVGLLQRFVIIPAAALDQPRYISKASSEIPATAVQSVRNELVHLYENAYRLISHGLSLHRGTIASERDLAEAAADTHRVMPLDIDDYYEHYIKGLHSAIIEFISKAQAQQSSEHLSNELYALRQASLNIVEAVKAMKHLHKNLCRYALSRDPYIRELYNEIRIEIATVLREIEQIREQGPDAETILSLDAARLGLDEASRKLDATLDEFIRSKRITAQIATSIMNDSTYAYTIGKNLVDMARTLLAAREPDLKNAEQQLALDETDIEDVLREDRG